MKIIQIAKFKVLSENNKKITELYSWDETNLAYNYD